MEYMHIIQQVILLLFICQGFATDDLYIDTEVERVTDDLISSGSTPPECEWDDCSDVHSTTPDDGIIKPTIKIRTTPRPPSTTKSHTKSSSSPIEGSGQGCDDEEECGSGSGQEPSPSTTDDIVFTSPDAISKTKEITLGVETGANITVTDPVVITVEMTDATTKRTVSPTRKYIFTKTTHPPINGRPKKGKKVTSVTLWIILGVAAGVLLALLVLAYAVYKYKSKDEGTYKIDESKNYDAYEERKPMTQSTNGFDKSSGPLIGKPVKKKSVKEWYV